MYGNFKQSKTSLEIVCNSLKDRDTFSRSDPCCHVFLVDASTHKRINKIGQTEQIQNDLNPRFRTKIPIQTNTLPGQLLEFIVKDTDGLSDDSLGKCFMSVQDILNAGGTGYSLPLGKGSGRITVTACDAAAGMIMFMIRGLNIKSKDMFGKSDPYIIVKQMGVELYKSEHIDGTKSPKWKGFDISAQKMRFDQDVQIECYDFDGYHAKPDFIGMATFNPQNLSRGGSREVALMSKSGRQAGMLCIDQCQFIQKQPKMKMGGHMGGGYMGQQQQTGFNPYGNPYPNSTPNYPPIPGQAGGYPPQQGGYPPQQAYPPQQGYPPQGYPPQQQGGYPPPQQQGYPPQQAGAYPPQQQYPPQGYPPQQHYPPQQGYPPQQQAGYPPQQQGYPPQGYPPPQQAGGYPPPQQQQYPPQGGYPPQQQQGGMYPRMPPPGPSAPRF